MDLIPTCVSSLEALNSIAYNLFNSSQTSSQDSSQFTMTDKIIFTSDDTLNVCNHCGFIFRKHAAHKTFIVLAVKSENII